MAAKDGERRMVFDTRGRRKNVVKVVYAVLALLMGTSLFLVIGPFNIASLFEDKNANSAATQLEDQAVTIERKLKKDPEDPQLLLNLTRARISAGNALAVSNPETGEVAYTVESRQQLERASEAWSKYLKVADEPSPSGAQVVAQALFGLAQTASNVAEAEVNVRAAAQAQQVVGEARPSLGSLSTLAIYRYYSFDYEGAEEARKKAAGYTNTKFERENLENELDQIGKRAHQFQAELAKAEKEAKKAREQGGNSGLGNPLEKPNPFGSGG
jgi:tetratricopeptide (TPR) repeat protein